MRRLPSLFWCIVFLLTIFLMTLLRDPELPEAQEQAREAVDVARQFQSIAERRQGEIEALQRICTLLQETLAAEQERFESCLAELGEITHE